VNGLDERELESRQVLGIFLFTATSRPARWSTQTPIQWVPGAPSLCIKRPGREANHSPPSNAEVKNAWSFTSAPPSKPSSRGAQLKKAQGKISFTSTLLYLLPVCIYIYLLLLNFKRT